MHFHDKLLWIIEILGWVFGKTKLLSGEIKWLVNYKVERGIDWLIGEQTGEWWECLFVFY